MIHYSCDRCQQPIAQDALRYVVKMQIQAEWDDGTEDLESFDADGSSPEMTLDSDPIDDLDQIQELLSKLNGEQFSGDQYLQSDQDDAVDEIDDDENVRLESECFDEETGDQSGWFGSEGQENNGNGSDEYESDEFDGDQSITNEIEGELEEEDEFSPIGFEDEESEEVNGQTDLPSEILESMFRNHRFDLCTSCFEKFQADPLSGAKVAKVRFSKN